ncbi:MAG: Hsp70 family protein [Candidatus Marinimicrobia bacterium]|nr:Hsp70 family protein [Candidatus Neomarinimicrobiota bacterium]
MIIGIDLGTTNSEVAIVREGRVHIVTEHGSGIVPSCIGLDPQGNLLVGREARNQYAVRPEHTVRSVKRLMGKTEQIPLGDQTYTPPELSAMILRKLKNMAEAELGGSVTRAVITVPAYFNDAQRQATREAGALAGLEVLRILNEPTAAGLAFEAEGVTGTRHVMVYDLGGGTFDVSILKMSGDVVEVLASHGDNHLGGDDIDDLLFSHLLDKFYQDHPELGALTPVGVNRLKLACEQLKMELSATAAARLAELSLPLETAATTDLIMEVTRPELEALCEELLHKTMASVRHVMAQSGIGAGALDEIILVGGSTRMPAIADLLEEELHIRPRHDVQPELAVAMGAGVMAARLGGAKSHRILVDVTPYTFGVSCMGEVNGEYGPYRFESVIKAGTPLPAQRGQVFFTMVPGQEAVQVRVFQGENPDCRENVFIGDFRITDLDQGADVNSPILLNMALDLDGLLTVTAIEQCSGQSKSVVIEGALKALDEAALAASREKIAAFFADENQPLADDAPPEDDLADEFEEDEEPAAEQALLERARRILATLDEVDRADLETAIAAFEAAEQPAAAEQALANIEDILYFAEGKS